jgi:Protein phosphatase 2C
MHSLPAPAAFRLPKQGCSQAEYEDAFAWNSRGGRYAVADGASSSAFARLWAHLLVRAYVAGQLSPDCLETDLSAPQAHWAANVEQRDLPWYALEQVRRGAFAALVGLTLASNGHWTVLAVGDCCVFQMRDGALQTALPLNAAEAFDNRPLLLGSRPLANAQLREQGAIVSAEGTWCPGDTFLLMSDALAAMFLRKGGTLDVLEFERGASGFRRWIEARRQDRALRNDDVSLLWLTTLPIDAPA